VSELRVRAPATTANLGPGFDCAACALGLWNELVVAEGDGVTIAGEGAGELPDGPENLALRAFALLAPVDGRSFAFANRIPLGRGLGSSAAAVALGLVAAARAAGREVVPGELLAIGARLEGHADNLAAALAGGLCLTWGEGGSPRLARIADAPPLEPVAVVPGERVATAASRAALPAQVSHADASFTAGRAALLGAGAAAGDPRLFAAALADRLHEPFRAASAPLLQAVREARPAGALGATLSGSGPTVIVWVEPGRGAECASDLAGRFRSARVLVLAPSAEGAAS
jgi:homoserine kinase